MTDDDRPGGHELLDKVDGVDGRLVGVDGLEDDFEGSIGLAVGVDDLAEGVEGLAEEEIGFVKGKVDLEVGVEGLVALEAACSVDRPVGVDGLDTVELVLADEEGLRRPECDMLKAEDETGCLDNALLRGADSG